MFTSLKNKWYRLKALRSLRKRYEYENVVNAIVEEYDTEKLLAKGLNEKAVATGRDQLATMQAKMKETDKFLEFLKNQKI